MRIRNLWAVAMLCGGIVTFGVAHATQVNRWPADVPCSAISKNPDGSYTLLTSITLSSGEVMPAGMTFPGGDEYDVWASCGS